MNQKTALAVLLIVLTAPLSLMACAAASGSFPSPAPVAFPDVEGHQRLTFSAALALGTTLHGNASTLNQPTRMEIYTFVQDNPGVHFRGMCNSLGLSVGVVQYHLDVLEHAGLITAFNDGQNKRYFQTGAYGKAEAELISLARHETAGKTLTVLSQSNSVLHRDLAQSLGISSQALTWHMNQLKDAGLVSAEKVGVNVKYTLTQTDAVKSALAAVNSRI